MSIIDDINSDSSLSLESRDSFVSNWHVWVIRRNRYAEVLSYIKSKLPEITRLFYPTIKKTYWVKNKAVTKRQPLYEGYIFLYYPDHAQVFHVLKKCPYVLNYIGKATEEEMRVMSEQQGKFFSEIRKKKFNTGEPVRVLYGPFKDFTATVLGYAGDQVSIRIDSKMLGQSGVDLVLKEEEIVPLSSN